MDTKSKYLCKISIKNRNFRFYFSIKFQYQRKLTLLEEPGESSHYSSKFISKITGRAQAQGNCGEVEKPYNFHNDIPLHWGGSPRCSLHPPNFFLFKTPKYYK